MKTVGNILLNMQNESTDGVAFKNQLLKKQILSYFSSTGNATITELSKTLNYSSPKIAELLLELQDDGLVKDYGKSEDNTVGRRPNIYGLKSNSIFFLGVDVKNFHINIGVLDLKNTLVKTTGNIPFQLVNNKESLDALCDIISDFLSGLGAMRERIIGIGLNLSGRINYKTGYSYSFFNFSEEPLSKTMEDKLGIQIFLENDSRAMAYGEFCNGVVTNEKDVLFVNMDYGIGMGVMINGQLYYGKSGFAGEFGHIHIFNNEIICRCGKKGCLETEASGEALVRLFTQRVKDGATTRIAKSEKAADGFRLNDIIDAANRDDVLAIECIAAIGEKLGEGIAMLINLFNPELVILGGTLSATGAYIRLPIKSAIYKYSLSLVSNETSLKMSSLGEQSGVIGACLLVRNRFFQFE